MAAKKAKLSPVHQHWHFVGILGTGMRAMARYAMERGVRVTGSDMRPAPVMEELTRRGALVQLGHDKTLLAGTADLVVASQAIREDNPELVQARSMGVETVRYPEMLGRLMDEQPGVAVAGSHGKSTTSSLIAYVLHRLGMDPSYLIGAEVPQLGNCGAHCAPVTAGVL